MTNPAYGYARADGTYGDGEIDEEFAYDLDTGDGSPNITHWMLPDPPKGNENV